MGVFMSKWDLFVLLLLPSYVVLHVADWNSSFSHPASKIVVITSCLLSDACDDYNCRFSCFK
jgi:hypothetical protein